MYCRRLSVVTVAALLALTAHATEPPKDGRPVPAYTYAPDAPAPRRVPFSIPRTWPHSIEELRSSPPLPSLIYFDLLESVGGGRNPLRTTSTDATSTVVTVPARSRRSLHTLIPMAVPTFYEITDRNVTNGGGFLPAEIVTGSVTDPNSGINYTANVWIGATSDRWIFSNFSTDGVTYSAPAQFAVPASYGPGTGGFMGDPRIAALLNSGTTMAHLYSVAAAYINHNQPYGQSGIYIYGSANGGQNWSGPAEVAVNLDGNVRLDQPVIAASWATSTNTTNFRYIAYTMYNIPDRANGSIRFRRSRGPIFCFGRCRIVGTPTPAFDAEQTPIVGNVASPQIAVDNTGAVHIVYVRYNAGQNGAHTIEEIVSDVPLDPTAALAWSGPRVVAQFFEVASDTVNGGIRAVTIPHARFNPAANRLCVTWHAATALLGATTQVYYASRAIGSPNFEGGTAIDPVAGRDQFMPALDSDATGNVLLAWYDRRNDGTNRDYEHFVRYITATGGTITGLDSHPSGTTHSNATGGYFIGDYTDVWRFPGRWNAIWAGRPWNTLQGDAYISEVR